MPGLMFQDVVCSRARANSNWYTVPLSFVVHTFVARRDHRRASNRYRHAAEATRDHGVRHAVRSGRSNRAATGSPGRAIIFNGRDVWRPTRRTRHNRRRIWCNFPAGAHRHNAN